MEDLNETIRPKTHNRLAIFLIIAIMGIAVYWFFIRPSQIKRECYDHAYSTPNLGNTQEWVTATKYYYEACLHSKGL